MRKEAWEASWPEGGLAVSAVVRADGTIALGTVIGSIHRIGAVAQGREACNGWTFWHVAEADRLTPIDAYREIIRAEDRLAG
ncbi:hypothetical protein ACIKTA_06660 [Hansschlegelia beijingensis]